MVKVHRANGMRKMHAKSVAELVRMTDLLRAGHAAGLGARLSDSLLSRFPFEPLGDLDRRIFAGQAHEIAIGRVGLGARRIGMFVQEAMKPSLTTNPCIPSAGVSASRASISASALCAFAACSSDATCMASNAASHC